MSLLSKLWGRCAFVGGPDFTSQQSVAIHLGKHELCYVMPGNHSHFFGFAEKRAQRQLPRTLIFAKPENDYRFFLWREQLMVDAGRWDYLDSRCRELASLNFAIYVVRVPDAYGDEAGLAEHIRQCYLTFLEGPEGVNTDIRQSYPEDSNDELQSWLVAMPSFEKRQSWLHWRIVGEVERSPVIYDVQPLDDRYFLMINFRYTMTGVKGHQLQDRIEQDIQRIFASVALGV